MKQVQCTARFVAIGHHHKNHKVQRTETLLQYPGRKISIIPANQLILHYRLPQFSKIQTS